MSSPFSGARYTEQAEGITAGVQKGDYSVITVCGKVAYITVIGSNSNNTVVRDAWNYIQGTASDQNITGTTTYNNTTYEFTITKGSNDIVCALKAEGSVTEADDGTWTGSDNR